ncbi:MAG: EamA family transporter [Nitriliruptoraceae bacterium]|nr:EamA family transporter [Nitriliruptoraceae bacterium]
MSASPDARSAPPAAHRGHLGVGIGLALTSAATFGSSGPMARSLIDAGWTSGGAVLVRLGGAAVVLLAVAAWRLRGSGWRPTSDERRTIVLYGLIAMAGTQLAFFNAVRTLDVGVALLLEFLAPVLLLVWSSVRTRTVPRPATLAGAGLTLVGLLFVLDLTGTSTLDPVGVLWGLAAACGLAGFFVLSERTPENLPPLVMAAGGTAIGAVVIALAGVVGLVPLAFTAADTVLAGGTVSWMLPAAWLVLASTVAAYLTGIAAVRRLGSRSASFVALMEVVFAVLTAWVLLAQLPEVRQLIGGACIVTGIIVIQRNARVRPPQTPTPALDG